jgi:peptidoglycan/LPS O-acetylase OafA/YrhL
MIPPATGTRARNARGFNLQSLDALRGLLATYVVLGHARWLLWAGHKSWMAQPHSLWVKALVYASSSLRYGHEAVMVFFVLSGFFIHFRAAEKLAEGRTPTMNTLEFFKRRADRLLPPYAFALLLTLALDGIGRIFFPLLYNAATGDALLDAQMGGNGNFSAAAVLPALLVLPHSLGVNFGTNGPLWSLGYEVVYYALYPAWLAARRAGAVAAYGGAMIFAIAISFFVKFDFFRSVLIHYPIWIAGAGLAEMLLKRRFPIGCIAAALVTLAAFSAAQVQPPAAVLIALYSLGGAAAVCAFALLPEVVRTTRAHAWLESLGLRSYTIYVCHFPMLAFLSAWSFQKLGARPMSGWLALGGALATIAGCCAAFELCERRFLHARLKAPPENP